MRIFVLEIKKLLRFLGLPFIILLAAFGVNESTWIPLAFFSMLIVFWRFVSGLKMDGNFVTILSFSLSYTFALYFIKDSSVESIGNLLCVLFAPIGCYLYGMTLVQKTGYSLQSLLVALFLLGLCFTFNVYYKVIWSIVDTGNLVNIKRYIVIDGVNDTIGATAYGLITSYGFAGLPILFFYKKSRKSLVFWLLGVLTIFSLLVSVHLLNRTGVVVFMASIVIAAMAKSNFKVRRFIPLIVLAVFVLVILITQSTFMDSEVASAFADRNEESSIAGGGDRFERWGDALSKMWMYPIGWKFDIRTYNAYVHNLWLDMARQSGWIPFITSIILTINLVLSSYRLVKRVNTDATAYLFCLVCCILLAASVEPVMEGCAFIFYIMCFLLGVSHSSLNAMKKGQLQ